MRKAKAKIAVLLSILFFPLSVIANPNSVCVVSFQTEDRHEKRCESHCKWCSPDRKFCAYVQKMTLTVSAPWKLKVEDVSSNERCRTYINAVDGPDGWWDTPHCSFQKDARAFEVTIRSWTKPQRFRACVQAFK
jgi:hypothetical protein